MRMVFDPTAWLTAPWSVLGDAVSSNAQSAGQGMQALLNGLCAVNEELGRFALERVDRHFEVANALLAAPEPGESIRQLADYVFETARAWDAEQSRLIGLLTAVMTETMLADGEGAAFLPVV